MEEAEGQYNKSLQRTAYSSVRSSLRFRQPLNSAVLPLARGASETDTSFMRNHVENAEIPNTMTFYRRLGNKVCKLEWAAFSAVQSENKIELFFYVGGKQIEDGNLVNAEVSIFVNEFDLDALVGKRFEVPFTFDNELNDHVSCVYYYDHKDFNNIVLEVLDRKDNSFHVRWSGTTGDIDFYDGSEPENRVIIEATFEFQETREATYNDPVIEPQKRPQAQDQEIEQSVSPEQLELFKDTN